ncbi:hypothetical protein [Haloarchaeobius sp. DFWS5]|uniref:hypothetical protein n=1 Tax=Haloarchaeobius sp. DFWS5 TaxID=3446114 RepID=UPI003EBFFCCC
MLGKKTHATMSLLSATLVLTYTYGHYASDPELAKHPAFIAVWVFAAVAWSLPFFTEKPFISEVQYDETHVPWDDES